MANAQGQTVWRWDQQEPFGANPADEDPDANSVAFDLPLRLPGQRYDKETALHYNYFRDYDPSIGRYAESDPIGLAGGINTYAYVEGRPLNSYDNFGLWRWYGNWGGANWTGGVEKPWNDMSPEEKSTAKPPINAQDQCYMAHDICTANCRVNIPCRADIRKACMRRCDFQLARCLGDVPYEGLYGPVSAFIAKQIIVNREPDPGPNHPSCQQCRAN